jgi:hypothetical protein
VKVTIGNLDKNQALVEKHHQHYQGFERKSLGKSHPMLTLTHGLGIRLVAHPLEPW